MPKRIVVKLVTRPTIKSKRRWEKVKLKKIYPDGTVFILRWLPESAKQYSYRTLGAVTLRGADIARASFVPAVEPEKKPEKNTESVSSKTLEDGAVSGSRDVRPTAASGCRAPPGNTLDLSPATSGDNRCAADVGTPADCTRFVEDDKRRVETNNYSKDNGGDGSSRRLRDDWG